MQRMRDKFMSGSSIVCACRYIYGSGLCRCCPALTCTPPWNAKYRPVKAIPARRLNRPTNPLVVDTLSPPPSRASTRLSYIFYLCRLFPLPLLHLRMEEWKRRSMILGQCVSKSQYFVLATIPTSTFSPRCNTYIDVVYRLSK